MTATTEPSVYTEHDRADLALIVAYEEGKLGSAECLYLFASLVRTGLAWSLQGSYGRTAAQLIDVGWITTDGEVNASVAGLLCDEPGCRHVGVHHHCPAGPSGSSYAQRVQTEGGVI